MDRRTDWALRRRWLPLNGGHRALDDCQTAYELLCAMTRPALPQPDQTRPVIPERSDQRTGGFW